MHKHSKKRVLGFATIKPMGKIADFNLYVRGEIPGALSGSLIVAANRRNKKREIFSRWHDSQSDIIKMDISPGRPGRIRVQILEVDPGGTDLEGGFSRTEYDKISFPQSKAYGYATQPNHGLNSQDGSLWVTNLLFGAPLEIDLKDFSSRRILRYVEVNEYAPRITNTSHFAWSFDNKKAYFHQSQLLQENEFHCVMANSLKLIEFHVGSGSEII